MYVQPPDRVSCMETIINEKINRGNKQKRSHNMDFVFESGSIVGSKLVH